MNTDDVYHDPWASPGSNPNRPLWSPGQPSSVAETSTADNSQIIDDTADTSINAGGSHYESEHVNSPSAPIQSPRRGREPATPSTPGQGAANVKKTQQERRPVPPKSTEPEMSITATVVALKRPERTKPLIQFNVYVSVSVLRRRHSESERLAGVGFRKARRIHHQCSHLTPSTDKDR